MTAITDGIVAIFTVVLACATAVLAWYTANLVRVSREASETSDRTSMMPMLDIGPYQGREGDRQREVIFQRFSLLNHGPGNARVMSCTARRSDGKELEVRPHSEGQVIARAPFYWDILDVNEGDLITIKVKFTDMKDRPYPDYETAIQVK